ncbi:myelin expression factor 2 isoform X1 [Rhipicephalus microplus]|uniref:myelin expression factor 2 isoform X1 n=1 Tax=Rhipicephalus microplus TaxID=6941 RepID=UPI003F6BF7B5
MPAPSEAAPRMNRSYYRSRSRSPVDYDRDRDSSRNRRRSDSRPDRQRSRAPSDRRVYVANVPFDCKWTDIKDLFRDKVGDVSYVELFEDETGKFRGCGIVELKDKASVPKAIEVLHRYEMKGRFLVVKEDFDVERDRFGRPIPRGRSGGDRMMDDRGRDDRDGYGRGGGGGGGVGFNTYGLSPQFLDSLGIVGPLSNRVFVANLDYKVTAKKLQEVFRIAGRVSNVDLRTDKEGNSKGHGIVEFEHPIEAVQAISMLNGQKLYNRAMSVRMDKYNEDLDGGLPSKLPTGLQGIGKGLGAGGNPLQMTAAQMAQMNMTGPVGGMPMGGGVNPVAAANMGLGGLGGMGGMGLGAGGLGAAGTGGLAAAGLGGMGSAGGLGGLSDRSMLGSGNLMGGAMASPTGLMGGLSGGLGGGSSALGAGNGGGLDYDRHLGGGDGYRSPRSSDAIMVQNLPMGYSWQNLRDRFREAGSVRYTDMKGRGTAIVRFNSERDAQRAVDMMNGIRLENRQIDVRLY